MSEEQLQTANAVSQFETYEAYLASIATSQDTGHDVLGGRGAASRTAEFMRRHEFHERRREYEASKLARDAESADQASKAKAQRDAEATDKAAKDKADKLAREAKDKVAKDAEGAKEAVSGAVRSAAGICRTKAHCMASVHVASWRAGRR